MKRLLFFIAVLFLFQGARAQSYLVQMPTGFLEAWYPFCNDAIDHGTIGYDLIANNTVADTSRFNSPRSAQLFNGVNSEIHYSTFFSMAGAFTYSCWLYPTANQNSVIFYNGNLSLDGMGVIMDNGAGGAGAKLSLWVGGIGRQITTVAPITLNRWHNVVMIRSGNAYLLYVDMVQAGFYTPVTTPSFPGFNTPTSVFQLGSNFLAGSMHFNGRLDDVAVYSRLLGFPTEVKKLYQFRPDAYFYLGNDTAIAPNSILLPIPSNPSFSDTLPGFGPGPGIPPSPANTAGAPYKYSWSVVGGVPFSSYDTVTVIPNSGPGTKYVLEITRPTYDAMGVINDADGVSCVGRDTITISHIEVIVDLGYNHLSTTTGDTTFCKGGQITLRTPPHVPGETYLWNTGSTDDTLVVTTSNTYYVTIDSTYTNDYGELITAHGSDTVVVHVPDSVHVHLGLHTVTKCLGEPYTMYSSDSADYGSPTYLWGGYPNVGGAITSTATATVTGTYWLQVTDSSCIASDTIRVRIYYDTVHVYNSYTQICEGSTIYTSASSNTSLHYQWTPTSGVPSSTNPATSITPDVSDWYVLTATVDSATECVARDSFYIDVQPNPNVYAGGNRFVCTHDSIRIIPTVTPSWYTHYIYNWTPGTDLDDSTAHSVIFTPSSMTSTNLVLVVTTPAGCSGKDSAQLYIRAGDFASLNPSLTVCPGDSVQLMPVSTEPGITTYTWYPATYLSDASSATPWIYPIVSENYIGVARSMYGCKDTVTLNVVVKPAAVIALADSVSMYPGDSYQIRPESNASFYSWTPPLGLTDTAISNPVATPVVNTRYIVTARTEDGCVAKDSIYVRVDAGSVMAVPNAFAPGGVNNNIKVIMRGLARLQYFRIFNRYGNLVYETTSIENGWDGTFGGKPQPEGVYVYEAQAVTDKGLVLHKQGNITLLR